MYYILSWNIEDIFFYSDYEEEEKMNWKNFVDDYNKTHTSIKLSAEWSN